MERTKLYFPYLKFLFYIPKRKKKSWELFRICLLNSTTNPARLCSLSCFGLERADSVCLFSLVIISIQILLDHIESTSIHWDNMPINIKKFAHMYNCFLNSIISIEGIVKTVQHPNVDLECRKINFEINM